MVYYLKNIYLYIFHLLFKVENTKKLDCDKFKEFTISNQSMISCILNIYLKRHLMKKQKHNKHFFWVKITCHRRNTEV